MKMTRFHSSILKFLNWIRCNLSEKTEHSLIALLFIVTERGSSPFESVYSTRSTRFG